MKSIIIFILLTTSLNSIAGDLLYTKNFTSSQRTQVEKCYQLDKSFSGQVKKMTNNGDIALKGMISQKDGYMFMTMTNAYGEWMEFTPLYCDLRSDKEIAAAEEAKKIRIAKETENSRLAKIASREATVKAEEKRLAEKKSAEKKRLADANEKEYRRKVEADKKAILAKNTREARDIILTCMDELTKELKDTWLGKPSVLAISGTLDGNTVTATAQSYKLKKLVNNTSVVQKAKDNTKTCQTNENVNSISMSLTFNTRENNGRRKGFRYSAQRKN